MELTLSQMMSMITTFNQGRLDYTTSELSLYCNIALTELCDRVEMQSLDSTTVSSTTSGTSSLTIPTGCRFITSISNLSVGPSTLERTLAPTDWAEVDSRETQVGAPIKYALYRDQILLWPSADSAYSIQVRFQEQVPVLTSSTSTARVDAKWHPAVAFRAMALAAGARNDLEQEGVAQARYMSFVQSVPTDLADKQRGRPSLRPAWTRRNG